MKQLVEHCTTLIAAFMFDMCHSNDFTLGEANAVSKITINKRAFFTKTFQKGYEVYVVGALNYDTAFNPLQKVVL